MSKKFWHKVFHVFTACWHNQKVHRGEITFAEWQETRLVKTSCVDEPIATVQIEWEWRRCCKCRVRQRKRKWPIDDTWATFLPHQWRSVHHD